MTTVRKREENEAFVLWFYAFPPFYSVGENWHEDICWQIFLAKLTHTHTKKKKMTTDSKVTSSERECTFMKRKKKRKEASVLKQEKLIICGF